MDELARLYHTVSNALHLTVYCSC